jgi:hypothetical protein
MKSVLWRGVADFFSIANKLSTPHGPVAPMQVISCGVAPASSSAKQRLDYLPTGLGEDML